MLERLAVWIRELVFSAAVSNAELLGAFILGVIVGGMWS